MLDKFRELLQKQKIIPKPRRMPKHIAITTEGKIIWAKRNKVELEEAFKKSFVIINSTIKTQIAKNVPVVTFYLLSTDIKELEAFSQVMDYYTAFFSELATDDVVHQNKIKITVLGKWYDLPGRVVEHIKKMVDATKDYDNFFVNFCLNYDGQEEIVDACKLIARQVKAEKIDIDSITKDVFKENIYASYFLPPDLIIKNGIRNVTSGLLLWDSPFATIRFSGKLWPDFGKDDFEKAIEYYQKH